MNDIRLQGSDGDYLVLETQSGEKFRLLIDESLKAAIRPNSITRLDDVSLTPREIQQQIRAGMTVDQLVSTYKAPISYVEKFAAPVLDELSHIIASALSVRISIAGDKYNEINQFEFGEIIANRLSASGATSLQWKCFKDESHTWQISVSYQLNGSAGKAMWSFEPKRLALAPENETAVALSTQDSLTENPIPKLRNVSSESLNEASNVNKTSPAANLTSNLADTVQVDTVIPFGRTNNLDTPAVVAPTNVTAPAATQSVSNDDLNNTADLLEALKRKRSERASSVTEIAAEPAPLATRYIEIVSADVSDASIGEESQEEIGQTAESAAESNAEPPAPATRRSGRTSIPSWDDIVFSTKTDEDQ